ncbi:hypothetical protein GGS21DRAFT_494648 [Xylaria nigripes]|nr:hypothetical protein GGS21DRAFT_494648 [Xylaria nigripes]
MASIDFKTVAVTSILRYVSAQLDSNTKVARLTPTAVDFLDGQGRDIVKERISLMLGHPVEFYLDSRQAERVYLGNLFHIKQIWPCEAHQVPGYEIPVLLPLHVPEPQPVTTNNGPSQRFAFQSPHPASQQQVLGSQYVGYQPSLSAAQTAPRQAPRELVPSPQNFVQEFQTMLQPTVQQVQQHHMPVAPQQQGREVRTRKTRAQSNILEPNQRRNNRRLSKRQREAVLNMNGAGVPQQPSWQNPALGPPATQYYQPTQQPQAVLTPQNQVAHFHGNNAIQNCGNQFAPPQYIQGNSGAFGIYAPFTYPSPAHHVQQQPESLPFTATNNGSGHSGAYYGFGGMSFNGVMPRQAQNEAPQTYQALGNPDMAQYLAQAMHPAPPVQAYIEAPQTYAAPTEQHRARSQAVEYQPTPLVGSMLDAAGGGEFANHGNFGEVYHNTLPLRAQLEAALEYPASQQQPGTQTQAAKFQPLPSLDNPFSATRNDVRAVYGNFNGENLDNAPLTPAAQEVQTQAEEVQPSPSPDSLIDAAIDDSPGVRGNSNGASVDYDPLPADIQEPQHSVERFQSDPSPRGLFEPPKNGFVPLPLPVAPKIAPTPAENHQSSPSPRGLFEAPKNGFVPLPVPLAPEVPQPSAQKPQSTPPSNSLFDAENNEEFLACDAMNEVNADAPLSVSPETLQLSAELESPASPDSLFDAADDDEFPECVVNPDLSQQQVWDETPGMDMSPAGQSGAVTENNVPSVPASENMQRLWEFVYS